MAASRKATSIVTLTDISPETWLVLGGMAVVLVVLAGLLLTRKPGAADGTANAELDRLRAERDDWRARQEQTAADLA